MDAARLEYKTITVKLNTGPDMVDITMDLERLIHDAKIANGTMSLTMVGSTGSITTIEYEPGVIQDLKNAIERLAPPGLAYEHEKAWHDGNGHSHIQAALLGPSLHIPIRNKSLRLGTWQQVVAINHDNEPRERHVEVTVTGCCK